MNATNYDKLMMREAQNLCGRKRLLLHCCCAPCSSACLERLKDYFDITALFYNPNIEDGEYERRKAELIRFCKQTGWADFTDCDGGSNEFYDAVRGLEREKEGGKRCEACFTLRLKKCVQLAESGGYDYFATTLTVSPLKDARLINAIGESLQTERVRWLYSDFKKRGGYLRSVELSQKYGLYRQNYCGCVFSRREKT